MPEAYAHLSNVLKCLADWDDLGGENEVPGIDDLDYMIDMYLEGDVDLIQRSLTQMSEREAALSAMYMYEEISRLKGEPAARQFMTALH